MSNIIPGQAKLLVPHRYRIRPALSPATNSAEPEDDDSVFSLATGRWTRGSRLSSFIDGELGSTFGRMMRAGGRLVVDPIDNVIGFLELKRLDDYLDDLDYNGWKTLKDRFDAEGYAPRLVEVLRYPVYPQSLRLRAQKITLKLAIFGQIRFDQVEPRIHFHSKDEFDESVNDLCAAAITLIPKQQLLACIPSSEDMDGFLSSLRCQISSATKLWKWPVDDTIMFKLAGHAYDEGRWNEAERLFLSATEARTQLQGEEHHITLNSMSWLALTYSSQGRWKESENLDLQVLEKSKRVLGEDHPDTLSIMSNLALTYNIQGRWKEAEDLGMTVLERRKQVLGEDDPYTLGSMHNLALTYRNQGQWKEAEALLLQVIEKRKLVLGEEHLDMLRSMNNLALTYIDQGRWQESELLQEKVLEKWKRVQGEEHPDTLTSMSNLAGTYLNQGRLRDAEDIERTVLGKRKRILGEEHPDTLASMARMADIYKSQDRLREAEELELQVLQLRRRVLGEEHPHTVYSIRSLDSTYRMQERHEEAEVLEKKITTRDDGL